MPDTETKYPHIHVAITGNSGNAFSILAAVTKAMRAADVPSEDIDSFVNEATRGSYDDLLTTAMRWVSVS